MWPWLIQMSGNLDARSRAAPFASPELSSPFVAAARSPSATIWNVSFASSILPFSAKRMPSPLAANRLDSLFCSALVYIVAAYSRCSFTALEDFSSDAARLRLPALCAFIAW